MLYESFKVHLEASRRATHASAWRKWEKSVPKPVRIISFFRSFNFFPEGPGSLKMMFHCVFWCPGALGTFLEWFWIDLGLLTFSLFVLKILSHKSNVVTSLHPETIDLSIGGVNPNWNNIKNAGKNMRSQTYFKILSSSFEVPIIQDVSIFEN